MLGSSFWGRAFAICLICLAISACGSTIVGAPANPHTVTLSSTSLTFGSQVVGTTSAPQAVTLTNTGTAAVNISSITASGDFSQANNCGSKLNAGANCTISVTFTPTAIGARSGLISITDNAVGSPQTVNLAGSGGGPAVGFSPLPVAFGNQPVGTASTPRQVTLTNTGSATLNITSIAVTGSNASDFALSASGATPCSFSASSLGAGNSCTFNVTFTPGAAGSRAANITVTSNAPTSPNNDPLSGTGTVPAVGLSPLPVAFGNQPVGTASTPIQVTLTNTGSATLNITSIAVTGTNASDFALSASGTTPCPFGASSLGAGNSCTFNVTFTPGAAGSRAANITVTSNAPTSPNNDPLSGTGTTVSGSGLVGYWQFNEGSGTLAADSSGNGNTGTLLNGAGWAPGISGTAVSLDGVNDTVNVGNGPSLSPSSAITLAAWINSRDPSPAAPTQTIVTKEDDIDIQYFLRLQQGGTIRFLIHTGGAFTSLNVSASLTANTWYHVAGVYDGAQMRVYLNGVQTGSPLSATGTLVNIGVPVTIGATSSSILSFNGLIDEARIYSRALSTSEIQVLAAAPAVGLSPLPVAFGNQPVGTASTPRQVTLTNTGSATLNITSIAVTGSNAGDFALSASGTTPCSFSASSLGAGNSCTFNVTFTPGAAGSRAANITVTSNAPTSPNNDPLSGTGVSGSVAVTPRAATITFTQTQQFTASLSNVTWSVDNIVGGNATVGTVSASGLYSPPSTVGSHTIQATDPSNPAANGTATVFVSNHPGTFTYHNDNSRTGQNLNEIALAPSRVNQTQFGKLFSYTVDGYAYAQPLYVANLNIPGQGFHNILYVATQHDSVYAFDADGKVVTPLWRVSFINPAAGITTIPSSDIPFGCSDIQPEIGITGTPVIDPASSTLYVVAKTKENGLYFQRLHALDIVTGAEKFGGPVVIQASVPGAGGGSQGGTVAFNPLLENQREGLLLSQGIVYVAFASHCDTPFYHGWVIGYDATTLQRSVVFNSTPNGSDGGIWQSGCPPAADASGNLYVISGNGTFDANTGGVDFGDSFLKLSSAGQVLDYFTPYDQSFLAAHDLDLGSGGSLLLPDQPTSPPHLMLSGGKAGSIYVVDRDNLGQFNSSGNAQIVQYLPGAIGPLFGTPAFWQNNIYFWALNDFLKVFALSNGRLPSTPTSQSSMPLGFPGAVPTISASGSTNGVVWALETSAFSSGNPAVLHAFDATNVSSELYNSNQAGTRDLPGGAVKFTVPTVANGKVYAGTQTQLTVFGLLP